VISAAEAVSTPGDKPIWVPYEPVSSGLDLSLCVICFLPGKVIVKYLRPIVQREQGRACDVGLFALSL